MEQKPLDGVEVALQLLMAQQALHVALVTALVERGVITMADYNKQLRTIIDGMGPSGEVADEFLQAMRPPEDSPPNPPLSGAELRSRLSVLQGGKSE